MKQFIIIVTFLIIGFAAKAQNTILLQGVCKDENGKPIENVSVYVHDSLLVSVTDDKGRFTYGHAKAGDKLRFAHIVFEPAYHTVKEKLVFPLRDEGQTLSFQPGKTKARTATKT